MTTGAITGYIDVAQLTLYAFWIFFAGLLYYLRREDKREGYPLESDRSGSIRVQGFPGLPAPKTFLVEHGGVRVVPRPPAPMTRNAVPTAGFPGAPLIPTGNPLADGLGPAAFSDREDVPETTMDGRPQIVPMRLAPEFMLEPRDPDPRGLNVTDAEGVSVGTVREIWVDRAEPQIRYLEVELAGPPGRRVLLPMNFTRIRSGRRGFRSGPGEIQVRALLAPHFAGVPALRNPDQVTRLEEDRITAYYAGGQLYAKPSRQEPLL